MTAVLYTLGVLIFAVAILVSIGLHELGHLVPAKAFGGKVTQYFIGFGPTVWSRQVGETECGVKAIPLGGYVKIVGMLPPAVLDAADDVEVDADGNSVVRLRKSNTGLFAQLISDARAAEWETIRPEDSERLFYKLPWWKKVVVMAGGPTVNLLIAFTIFTAVFATYGNISDPTVSTTVSQVQGCIVPAKEDGRVCKPNDPVSPAKKAGIEVGDRIVAFNGTPITTWQQLQDLIHANGDGAARITVIRNGTEVTLRPTTTTVTPRFVSDGASQPTKVGFLGVVAALSPTKGGPGYTLGQMGVMTKHVVSSLATLPVKVWGVARAIVGLQKRDPNGPVSIVGGGRFAGEIGASKAIDVREKAIVLLMLIADFNLFVGMLNFVPLLPLDGGHIASALWEAVRRRLARLRRLPDPGYVDAAKLLPVAYVVASVLLVMGVVLIVADVVVPVHIT